jgi:glutathione synthase/RimK-type ligase-like ATP-grasp enzyme
VRVAFLVPTPGYPEPWRWAFDVEARALEDNGVTVDPSPWTEASDLSGFDLVLPLVAWGYHERYPEWLAFLDRLERDAVPVINPVNVLRWSSHKSYLAELGDRGVPTVPTVFVETANDEHLEQARGAFGARRLVVKPPVSGGAFGTHRLKPGEPLPADSRGKPLIIQPLIETIASAGEYSLMLFDGVPSHCVVKRPKAGEFRVQPHLGGTTEPCAIPAGAEALAKAALAVAPGRTTYARVDMIPDSDGRLMIMELELVEPALFLDQAPGSDRHFADAIISAAAGARE